MPTRVKGVQTGRSDVIVFPPDELDKIVIGLNLRGEVTDESLEDLAPDIALNGQEVPGIVFRNAQGKPQLCAGERRLRSIMKINRDPTLYGRLPGFALGFKAVFQNINEDNAWERNLAENLKRRFDSYDKACAARKMVDILGKTQHEAAAKLEISYERCSLLLKALSLPNCALRLWHLQRLAESNVRLLFGLPNEVIYSLCARVDAGDLAVAEFVTEATKAHRLQGDVVRRGWSEGKREIEQAENSLAATYVREYFDGEIADGGLRGLLELVPDAIVEQAYRKYRQEAA